MKKQSNPNPPKLGKKPNPPPAPPLSIKQRAIERAPWQQGPLLDWSICGMNHYHVNGEKLLFVSMTKDGKCITEEGPDDKYLWNRLYHKARWI